jgi:hypothetical protein
VLHGVLITLKRNHARRQIATDITYVKMSVLENAFLADDATSPTIASMTIIVKFQMI